jgi:phage-related tail fiber protein
MASDTYLSISGGTLEGPLLLSEDPTLSNQAATMSWVQNAIAESEAGGEVDLSGFVKKIGDSMTGQLKLVGDPISALDAASKGFVDASLGGKANTEHSHDGSDITSLLSQDVLPKASTVQQGIVQLSNAVTGSSQSLAASQLALVTALNNATSLANSKISKSGDTISGTIRLASRADSSGFGGDAALNTSMNTGSTGNLGVSFGAVYGQVYCGALPYQFADFIRTAFPETIATLTNTIPHSYIAINCFPSSVDLLKFETSFRSLAYQSASLFILTPLGGILWLKANGRSDGSTYIAETDWIYAGHFSANNIVPDSRIKVGTVFFCPRGLINKAYLGALEVNGAAVSRTTYKYLFQVIGTIHGNGDGGTTFNLPTLAQLGLTAGSSTYGAWCIKYI